ncbi:TlpA disulfide reductase family protein [Arcticibacter tournemirensis]|uniref:AhpC/TSA family protein n=1 Tax=Arcticibacter tournemirensis TaxID=699437 RepID=A0A4Q0MFE2_9SPHI|nr:TlpA disulfide reductase family protein [Arcticibacter tournemirensis]RXF72210.1 AhpC/TSA family protein [Arcticibacter tournemirensis]
MKLHYLILAAMAPVFVAAQTPNFTLTGKIGNLNKPAKVYFDYTENGNNHMDSADVVNGAFKFSGNITGIAFSRMTLSHDGKGKNNEIYAKGAGDVIYFYFGSENIKMTSADSLYNAKFTGSKVYNEMLAFDKATGETVMTINRTANLIMERATPEQQKDPEFFKALDVQVKGKTAARKEKLVQFAKDHPDSYFSVAALTEAFNAYRVPLADIEAVFNKLSEQQRKTYAGINLAKLIEANSATAIGAKAPVFAQNDTTGKPIALTDLRGKYVLVEFWASWCHPCRLESPNLLKQYQIYKEKGFEILAVSLDSDRGRWLEAITKDGLTWPQVSDLKGSGNEVAKLYGVTAVPANFLISPEGKIIAKDLRGEDLNKKLAETLN